MDNIRLKSVNWEFGMLLAPEHLLRQEEYLESLLFWNIGYMTTGSGLVGGGVRLPASDLGAVRHDPTVVLEESHEGLGLSISNCRGLTPSGRIVEIEEASVLSERFSRDNLAGVAEATVFVVCNPSEKRKVDGIPDSFNPQLKTERAFSYRIALDVTAADKANAVAVARIRRPASGMHYEKDPLYIPACLSLSAHSELTAGWRKISESVNNLAASYAELHRAMREFMVLFTERGIETEVDRDSLNFAERMVMALQETAYLVLDRTQPPERFFGSIRKLLHQAATFFDLAPGMQQYYETLRETGETELVALIDIQKHALQTGRTLRLIDDLGIEVRNAVQSLSVLEKLERALEGKYIDFRRSPSLEGMNFIFDRQGKVLYKLVAKPSRVQGVVDELTIYFSQLRLEGRDRYRLILVGDRNHPYPRGTTISAEIRLNEGSGFRREAIILQAEAKLDDQYNFELDFEAQDVPTITDIRVTVQAYHAVHTALLFARHRFFAGRTSETPSAAHNVEATPNRADVPVAPPAFTAPVEASQNRHVSPAPAPLRDATPRPQTPASRPNTPDSPEALPSWAPRKREETTPPEIDPTVNRPRRRRLE
ncbi:MAG: type VI secretion system baseplate subunit TssK [Terracidiphilus sp.]|jgi:hypothetical protein